MSVPRDLTPEGVTEAVYRNFRFKKNHAAFGFNCKIPDPRWESDFVSVTKAGYVHEVEVKLTKPDFFKDFEKVADKHGWYWDPVLQQRMPRPVIKKHDLIQEGQLASYFWFAMPQDLIDPQLIPPYCGVIFCHRVPSGWIRTQIVRPAPRLNKVAVNIPEFEQQVMRSQMYRSFVLLDRIDRLKLEKKRMKNKK